MCHKTIIMMVLMTGDETQGKVLSDCYDYTKNAYDNTLAETEKQDQRLDNWHNVQQINFA